MSAANIEQDIYTALKRWHRVDLNVSSIDYLHLFEQARAAGAASVREATNRVLLEALETLAVSHERHATILRKRFLDGKLMRQVANQLNVSEATAYRLQQEAVAKLAVVIETKEANILARQQTLMAKRMEPAAYIQLVGVEASFDELLTVLTEPTAPWLVSIEGLGGLGKTSLADALARHIIDHALFDDFGWVSARQNYFNAGGGIMPVDQPALTAHDLGAQLLSQLMPDNFQINAFSFDDSLAVLKHRLRQRRHLVVIDNLETVADIRSLLPVLRDLSNPSKFLLTSRQALPFETGIYHFKIPQLSEQNALQLIRQEAAFKNMSQLADANEPVLKKIYRVVGGNPLALKLVIGQTYIHALDIVLDDMANAASQQVERLYEYIYRRAWKNLSETERRLFLAMPLVSDQGGDLNYLAHLLPELSRGQLLNALAHLATLSLIESKGTVNQRRFSIHNLTRTFLQEQIAKWV